MRGIAGRKDYLLELLSRYDEYESLGTVLVQETMRLTGWAYEEAAVYWQMEWDAKTGKYHGSVYDHIEQRRENR